MKKTIYIFLALMVLTSGSGLRTEVGCMDISKHKDTSDGYDYKKLHYVQCNCPCSRYKHLAKRGKCIKCGHYHGTKPLAADNHNGSLHTSSLATFLKMESLNRDSVTKSRYGA